jgi:hypothetical protein
MAYCLLVEQGLL